MSWVKENKFLTGYIAVMVIGVGALGYKVVASSGALDEATDRYASKAAEYNRLRSLAPSANRKNLEAFQAQKDEAAQVISSFQAELAKKEFPLEQITPEQFQDRLKIAVTAVHAKAKELNVKLEKDDKFYLGFDRYETQPPDKEAAAALGRQLKAIEWVVQQAMAAGISELRKIDRPELPEEKGKGGKRAAADDGANTKGGGKGGNKSGSERAGRHDLVSSTAFDIIVVSRQQQAANLLNTIISPTTPQFFIPRSVRINNQNPKGPQRSAEVAPPAAADPNAPAPPAPASAAPSASVSYIVGEERVELALRLEVIDFADPAHAKPEGGKK